MIMLLAAEGGFALYQAAGAILLGWVQAEEGLVEEGLAQMRQGLAAWLATGTESFRSYYLALLAEVHGKAGQTEEGLRLLAETLEAVHHSGECLWEAELYRLKGEFLARDEAVDEVEVEVCFQHALEAARRKSARSLEIRAAMSLSHLWQKQGKHKKARQLLAETYGWFTEGLTHQTCKRPKHCSRRSRTTEPWNNTTEVWNSCVEGQVYRSTDGGNSWSQLGGTLATGGQVNRIAIDPTNPSHIYASVYEEGVYELMAHAVYLPIALKNTP
jgi:hypothetical protein